MAANKPVSWYPMPKGWESGLVPSSLDCPGVYFLKWGPFIKIGAARNVVSRCQALHWALPCGETIPLGWIHVPYDAVHDIQHGDHEVRVHHALADYRVRGEWFRDCPTVRRFIERFAKPLPGWVADHG